CVGVRNTVVYVFRHKNSVISTLIPYNLFLFANLIGGIAVYSFRGERFLAGLILAGIVLFDGIVGVLLFKRGAEQVEIVEGISRIRDGEVEFKLATDNLHGANREMADAVNNIGEGIRKAVRTSMKDEQMKTDLITNVSHDIKTPLTSIINYVDLLKRLKIEQEPAKSYIGILDNKAQRLKQLTDDLVEASKISSGNIELNKEKLNLTELINQSLGEFSEKLEEQNLQVVFENNNEPAFIYADSRRMWRVVENLFNNICKYAMEGTRVYVDMFMEDGKTGVSFKNISKQQMNIRPEELTERFIRGDSSRSTEGSGLGLSIAQSLVQVQGGSFQIYLDGDLFKIVIEFAAYVEE
ncbi:MAG: HAMP domain-containing histidine kinase, partial [Muribaculaceae bacterium]|nr:HAMP domain-containing histidine kinase [Muribaculaceae bacterium]